MYISYSRPLGILGALLLTAGPVLASGGLKPGRFIDTNKTFSVRLMLGQVNGVSGSVEETKRAGASRVTTEGRFLETYTFEELGFDDSFGTFGIELEKQWKYITLQGDLKYMKVEGDATARRIYAIGVEEVSFGGQDYEYMLIPEGERFTSELEGLVFDTKVKWTPFHLESSERYLSFTPWVMAGIYAVGGTYTIDAGPPRGITTYEIDPFPYVVGGKGEGTAGLLMPSLGFGGEVRFSVAPSGDDWVEVAIQGDVSILDVVADTGDFGISARNEKTVDTTYYNMELRAQVEFPLANGTDFLVGASFKRIEAEAEIEAKRKAPGQTTTEKYDKYADLEFDTISLFTGFKF